MGGLGTQIQLMRPSTRDRRAVVAPVREMGGPSAARRPSTTAQAGVATRAPMAVRPADSRRIGCRRAYAGLGSLRRLRRQTSQASRRHIGGEAAA